MIYLDYSSNYPVKKEVLDYLSKVELNYYGNVNSVHFLGTSSLNKYEEINNNIFELLN
jgi:cysteine sulfinate desulfinase/cysteine desulfurase-like protein